MLTILLSGVLGYAFVLALVWSLQDRFIYFPSHALVMNPRDVGCPYEDIVISPSNGIQLHGWYIPAEKEAGVLVYFHGNAGNIGHRVPVLPLFPRENLSICLFDYRGYGRSKGRPSEAGLYADGRAVIAWLIHERRIPPEKLILLGESLGGAIAARLAREYPVAGIILISAFPSLADIAAHHYWYFPVRALLRARYPTADDLKATNVPVLMIHGRADRIVPLSMAARLREAGGERVRWVVVAGGHNDVLFVEKGRVQVEIRSFIQTCLGR